MSDTDTAIERLEKAILAQNLAIAEQNKINAQLALAEHEKSEELRHQTAEIELQRKARETHTQTLTNLVSAVNTMLITLQEILNKRYFDNIEQLLEILIPILSQVSTSLTLRSSELDRLERLITETRRSDINVGQTIKRLDNKGTTNIGDS